MLLKEIGLTPHIFQQTSVSTDDTHPLMVLLVSRFIRGRMIVLGLVGMLIFGMLGSLVLF